MSLLPANYSEFRSKRYWDDFFMQRDRRPFEWYVAAVKDILPLLNLVMLDTVRLISYFRNNLSNLTPFH